MIKEKWRNKIKGTLKMKIQTIKRFTEAQVNDVAVKLKHGKLIGIIKILSIEEHPVFASWVSMTYEYLEMSDFLEYKGHTLTRSFRADGSDPEMGITHKIIKWEGDNGEA